VQQALAAERQQYQTLFHFAPDGYLVTNSLGVIHDANPAATRLFGMPAPHLQGKPLAGLVATADAPRFHALLHALVTAPSATPVWTGYFHPLRHHAFMGELTVAIRQEEAPHGRWYHWLLRDITARIEMEAALRAALADQQLQRCLRFPRDGSRITAVVNLPLSFGSLLSWFCRMSRIGSMSRNHPYTTHPGSVLVSGCAMLLPAAVLWSCVHMEKPVAEGIHA